jgi:hypothetical protein
MKRTNIIYWTSTLLFGAFMLFSAIPDIIMVPEAVEFINGKLGYPAYFLPFIGVMKALGVIAIVIPGFPRIKEWAYAGLFFDLFGAVYSNIAAVGWDNGMFFMILPFSMFALSYIYFHKKLNEAENKVENKEKVLAH